MYVADIDSCEQRKPTIVCISYSERCRPGNTRYTGGRNSAANFQGKVPNCFSELEESFKVWLDDYILFTKSENELLKNLCRFFELCRDRNLIMSLTKLWFFLNEAKWCGRISNEKGILFNPNNLSGLRNWVSQISACVLSYLDSSSIPRFPERVAPLRELLDVTYLEAGRGGLKDKSHFEIIPQRTWLEHRTRKRRQWLTKAITKIGYAQPRTHELNFMHSHRCIRPTLGCVCH